MTTIFNKLLNDKSFIINLEGYTERYESTCKELRKGGFKNIIRFNGIDGHKVNLHELFSKLNNNYKFEDWDKAFHTMKSKQGSALSHISVWLYMIKHDIQVANIFEDDIVITDKWDLANMYYESTPKDYDMLFFGSKVYYKPVNFVSVTPCYCVHAYRITLRCAKCLLNLFSESGFCTLDSKIFHLMCEVILKKDYNTFKWYLWNTNDYDENNLEECKFNNGLIHQNLEFDSIIDKDNDL